MGTSSAVGLLVGAAFLFFGLFALWRPDSVRRCFQNQQIFKWSKRGYDMPGMNLFFRVLGVLFFAAGLAVLWSVSMALASK